MATIGKQSANKLSISLNIGGALLFGRNFSPRLSREQYDGTSFSPTANFMESVFGLASWGASLDGLLSTVSGPVMTWWTTDLQSATLTVTFSSVAATFGSFVGMIGITELAYQFQLGSMSVWNATVVGDGVLTMTAST